MEGGQVVSADLDRVRASMGKLQSGADTVRSALGALGVGMSVGAMLAYTKSIINGVDALNDLKDATGASIENISALEDTALRTGTGFDTVSTALIKMNKGLATAKPGSDTEKAFTALGLSIEKLKALDPAEALLATAQALAGFADDGNKARLTQELFGKSLKEVAPLLKDLAEKGRLNATVTTAQAEEAEKFNHQLAVMNKNATDLARTFFGAMAESINKTIELFREGAKEGKGFFAVIVGEQLRMLGLNDGQKEYANRIADITEKLKDNNLHASRRAAFLRELAALQAKVIPTLDGSYDKAEASRLARGRQTVGDVLGGGGHKAKADDGAAKRLSDAKADVAAFYAMNDLRVKSAEDAEKAIEKAYLESATARDKYNTSLITGLANMQADTQAQQDANDRMGLGKEALAALDMAKLESQAVTLEVMAIKTLDRNLDEAQYQLYKDQAQQLRELATLKGRGAAKETGIESAKAADKISEDFAKGVHDDLKGALSTAFRDTKNPIEAFGDALGNVIFTRVAGALADAMATQFINSAVGSGLMSMFGFEKGGAFGAQPFANGGAFTNSVVNKPTLFQFASGGSFKKGVMGEAGPEAIMPLSRGPDGKLGVKASGSTAPTQTINVVYNMTVGDVASVSMVRQAVAGSERRIAAGIGRSMSYGGALA